MPIATTGMLMVIDTSKCIACRSCQVACQQWNSLTAEDTEFTGNYKNPPDMSGANLTVVKNKEVEVGDTLKWLFFVDRCRHCENPYCMGACPLGAINRHPWGMVYIREDLCDPMRCHTGPPEELRPCQRCCPYGIPRWKFMKNGLERKEVMRKCTFCYDRFGNEALPAGTRKPACVVACPTGALAVGKASKWKTIVIRRVRYLRNHGHPNARVYAGRRDSGGTHVVWILTEPAWRYQDSTIEFVGHLGCVAP